MMIRSTVARALVVAAFATSSAGVGCSISNSSGSMSDSSGSMSDSSGSSANSSASSSADDTAYRGDIESYTVAALDARDVDAIRGEDFTRALSSIAEAHGITDWHASASTFRAVGSGLRRSGLSREQALDFHRRVFGPDGPREQMLMHGFRDADKIS